MSEHALLSASSAHRWMACPGSIALCKDIPDTTSKYAEEGTKAHYLASQWLNGFPIEALGCDDEMLDYVRQYVDFVTNLTGNGTLLVERRVDYSSWIGVTDSFGTSDAIIISENGEELTVVDLKYGKGVRVDAEDNEQLMLYAMGAISELEDIYDIKTVTMVIHQPRINHVSVWQCDVPYLQIFADKAMEKALLATGVIVYPGENLLSAGEEQCRFCPARKTCPELEKSVRASIGCDFEDLTQDHLPVPTEQCTPDVAERAQKLSANMAAVPLIETWCKAIRARVEAELMSGNDVPGFKLVEGKRGNRKWRDEEEVKELLTAMRIKKEKMYEMSLISPTTAEKLFKDTRRRWKSLEEHVVRKDGAPSVAPVSDKRPAVGRITLDATMFDAIED